MLDRLEIKNGARDANFQICRLHIDLFHDDFSFWPGLDFMGGEACGHPEVRRLAMAITY